MRFYPVKLNTDKNFGSILKNNPFFPHNYDKGTEKNLWLLPEFPDYKREKQLLEDPPSTLFEERITNDLIAFTHTTPKPIFQLIEEKNSWYFPEKNNDFIPNVQLQSYLSNRRLLLDELPFSLEEIHSHVAQGWVVYEPGILPRGSGFECVRCGNREASLFAASSCFRCKGTCVYCRSCLMMGRVTSCSPLVTWKGENSTHNSQNKLHVMAWRGTLSLFQKKASDKLLETISQFSKGVAKGENFLIWAVCGSGKTEMLFHGIQAALNGGLKVLIATPRTDVVLELEPRFKQAFPETIIHAFYGGAKDRFAQGELIISTTHQLLRFYKSFDLVIIDEVDAFPYTSDRKLRYAVGKAKKEQALTVYVTATPDDQLKREAESGKILCAKVARRYHRHPLPEPKLVWAGNWKKLLLKEKLSKKIYQWIVRHLEGNKQLFLFVPSVKVMGQVEQCLKMFLSVTVGSVHSADEDRREKVMDFREGKIRVLVTTTILERGVTVKGVQVAVLGAEDRIFTESALVQIAGRAGRSPEEPTGEVVYFHYGKTKEMVKAIKHIKRMNQLGEEELLKENGR